MFLTSEEVAAILHSSAESRRCRNSTCIARIFGDKPSPVQGSSSAHHFRHFQTRMRVSRSPLPKFLCARPLTAQPEASCRHTPVVPHKPFHPDLLATHSSIVPATRSNGWTCFGMGTLYGSRSRKAAEARRAHKTFKADDQSQPLDCELQVEQPSLHEPASSPRPIGFEGKRRRGLLHGLWTREGGRCLRVDPKIALKLTSGRRKGPQPNKVVGADRRKRSQDPQQRAQMRGLLSGLQRHRNAPPTALNVQKMPIHDSLQRGRRPRSVAGGSVRPHKDVSTQAQGHLPLPLPAALADLVPDFAPLGRKREKLSIYIKNIEKALTGANDSVLHSPCRRPQGWLFA